MNKTQLYQQLYEQTKALISDEPDLIANMANISALLFDAMEQINWAGFYRVENSGLVLGPFQGKVACIRIPIGTGVCGVAAETGEIQCVSDVHNFEGHIACDVASNAEIVIPLKVDDKVVAVLDIDSIEFARFDEVDQQGLQAIVNLLESNLVKFCLGSL
ncbi:MAG: GAF domain-containing protein [Alteromonadaceae bacterium]|nr:GAF domain-containing protein [Alteromonadaceae bacterium]